MTEESAYGLWSLVVINSLIFIIFAFSFAKPQSKRDWRGIAKARRLSRETMRDIRENLFFALVYNVLGIPIAAGVLYPFFGVLLSSVIASVAMTFNSVSVISNALRLNKLQM